MKRTAAACSSGDEPRNIVGNFDAQVRETHTGVVVLFGDRAYKAKKPIATDFLDFTTLDSRAAACERELALNRRLSPDSYLGLAHFAGPGKAPAEPVIVMRRYPDSQRLASLVEHDLPAHDHLEAIAEALVRFHIDAQRSELIDSHGTAEAIATRWRQNLVELRHFVDTVIAEDVLVEAERLSTQFIAGRADLFADRVSGRRIVDGHADLMADDIFCAPDGPAILDCLEFDEHLRYVDVMDDAAFLAMDLEFLGRADLGNFFLETYCRLSGDPATSTLKDFYIAYRAVVRAKVDCVRFAQGHREARADAHRHLDIAVNHLRTGTVQLIVVGGGPGTGKTTLSRALAEHAHAEVISTDDVRRELQQAGLVTGAKGVFGEGLYAPANVEVVYDEVLRRARQSLVGGRSVILDGTWRDPEHRQRARELAGQTSSPIVELTCAAPLADAAARIENRHDTTSDATPQIAATMSAVATAPLDGHIIDTSRPIADSVSDALQICCLAI
jgi:aminoglycoside phosphotransferase family enzyme/predicted kinase